MRTSSGQNGGVAGAVSLNEAGAAGVGVGLVIKGRLDPVNEGTVREPEGDLGEGLDTGNTDADLVVTNDAEEGGDAGLLAELMGPLTGLRAEEGVGELGMEQYKHVSC